MDIIYLGCVFERAFGFGECVGVTGGGFDIGTDAVVFFVGTVGTGRHVFFFLFVVYFSLTFGLFGLGYHVLVIRILLQNFHKLSVKVLNYFFINSA
jgi:hypothetical protein